MSGQTVIVVLGEWHSIGSEIIYFGRKQQSNQVEIVFRLKKSLVMYPRDLSLVLYIIFQLLTKTLELYKQTNLLMTQLNMT